MANKNSLFRNINRLYYAREDNVPIPQVVMIEPTNICNLKCSMCYVQQHIKTQNSLTLEDFRMIIDQFPRIRELIFCGIGEPLLNKDLFQMISYAKNSGINFINLVTNGKLLSEEACEKIVHSNINRIQISVHSFNLEIFSKIRNEEGINLERLKEGIRRLISIKRKLNSQLQICCNAVVNKFNYGDLIDFIRNAKELGADRAEFIQMTTANDSLRDVNAPLESMANLAKEVRKYARNLNIEVSFLSGNYYGRCYQLWDFIMIHADGTISPCNGIFPTENIGVGNIFDNKIEAVWNSEKYRALRRSVIEGELKNCRFCESGYCLEGKDLRWFRNYYFRPLKRMARNSLFIVKLKNLLNYKH